MDEFNLHLICESMMILTIDLKTKALVILVIVVHLMFFVLETIFWMQPQVYSTLLVFLDNPVSLDYPTQALTLKNLFINQGFYNLFLSIIGIVGMLQVARQQMTTGLVLILVLCFCGIGAGIILALSTKAYVLALFQGVPAAIAFYILYPLYQKSISDV